MNWFNNKAKNSNFITENMSNKNMSKDQKNNVDNISNEQKKVNQSNFFDLNQNVENISDFNQDDLNIDSMIKEKFDLVDKVYLSKKKIQKILISKNIFFTNIELDNIYQIAIRKNLHEITFDLFLNNLISSNKINNYFKNTTKSSLSHVDDKLLEKPKNINNENNNENITNDNNFNQNKFNINNKILKNEIDKIYKIIARNANNINGLLHKINENKITKSQNMQNNKNNLDKDFFRLILLEEEQKKNLLDLQTDKLKNIFLNEIRSLHNFNNNSIMANYLNNASMNNFSHNLRNIGHDYNQINLQNKHHLYHHLSSCSKNHNQDHNISNILYNPQNDSEYNLKNIYEQSESKLNNLENLILNLHDKFDKKPETQKQILQDELDEMETKNFENKSQNLNSSTILDDYFNQDNKSINLYDELEKTNLMGKNIIEANNINSEINNFEKETKNINDLCLKNNENFFLDADNNLFFEKKLNENKLDKLESSIQEIKKTIDENPILENQKKINNNNCTDTLASNHLNENIENIHNDIKTFTNEIESKFNFLSNNLKNDKENIINKIEEFFKKSEIDSENLNKKLLLDDSNSNDKNKFVYLNFDDNNNYSKINDILEDNNLFVEKNIKNNEVDKKTNDLFFENKKSILANKYNTNNIDLKNTLDKKNVLNNDDFNVNEASLFSAKEFLSNKEENMNKIANSKENTENILNEITKDNKYFNSKEKDEIYNNSYLDANINNYRESLEVNNLESAANDNIDDFLNNLDKKIINNVKDLSNIKNILKGENIDKQVLSDLDVSISLFDSMSKN